MKAADLKKWMERNGKNAVDVASITNVSLATVTRFLKGKAEPRPIVRAAFERLVAQEEKPQGPKVA